MLMGCYFDNEKINNSIQISEVFFFKCQKQLKLASIELAVQGKIKFIVKACDQLTKLGF
jgi:hypothetical protein